LWGGVVCVVGGGGCVVVFGFGLCGVGLCCGFVGGGGGGGGGAMYIGSMMISTRLARV